MLKRKATGILLAIALAVTLALPSTAFAAQETTYTGGSWPQWRNTNTLQGNQEVPGDIVTPRESAPMFISGNVDSSPCYADINGDGEKEVLMVDSSRVTAIDINGAQLWMTEVMQANHVYAVKDLDHDGVLEALVFGDKKMIILEAQTGRVLHVEPFSDNPMYGRFVLEDLDNDGNYEIVVFIYKQAYLPIYKFTHENGSFRCQLANRIIDTRTEGEGNIAAFYPGLAAADVNDDGIKELIVIRAYGLDIYNGVEISRVVKFEQKFDPVSVQSVQSNGDYPGYPCSNLIDGDNSTYWIASEGAASSNVEFTFAKAVNLSKIRTYNMYMTPITAYAFDYVANDWVEVGSSPENAYTYDGPSGTSGHEINFGNYVFTDRIKLVVGKGSVWAQPQGGEIKFFGENVLAPILPSELNPSQITKVTCPENTAGMPLDILTNGNDSDYWWSGPSAGGKATLTYEFNSAKTLSAVKFTNLIVPYAVVEGWDEGESKWVELAKVDSASPVVIGIQRFLAPFVTNAVRIRVERSNFGIYEPGLNHVQLSEIEFYEMNPYITPVGVTAVKGENYPGYPPSNAIDGSAATYFISGRWPKDTLVQDGFADGKFYSELEISLPAESVIGKIITNGFYNKLTLSTSNDDGGTWNEYASVPYAGATISGFDFSSNPLIVPANNKIRLKFTEGPFTDTGYDVHDTTHGTGSPKEATSGRVAVSVQGAEITFLKPFSSSSAKITPLDTVEFTPHLATNGRNYGHMEVKDIDGDGAVEIVALNDGVSYHISVYENDGTGDISLFGDQYFGYSAQPNPDDGAAGRFAGGKIPYLRAIKNSLLDVNADGRDEMVYGAYTYVSGSTNGNWKLYVADTGSYDSANWKFNDLAVFDGYYLYDIAFILPDPTKPVFIMSQENTMTPKGTNPYELFTFENGSFVKLAELNGGYVSKSIHPATNISAGSSNAGENEIYTPDVDNDGQNEMIILRNSRYDFINLDNAGAISVTASIDSSLGSPSGFFRSANGQPMLTTAAGGVMHLVTLSGQDMWTRTSGGDLPVIPTVGDIDGDNRNEMVFSLDGTIRAYFMEDGKMESLFSIVGAGKPTSWAGGGASVIPLVDMNADGKLDIVSQIIDTNSLKVFQVHNGYGDLMWEYALQNDPSGNSLGVFTIQDYIVGDVTGDGIPDIIASLGTSYPNGRTIIIDGSRHELIYTSPMTVKIGTSTQNTWDRSTLPNPGFYSLADFNKDGINEIYFVALEGYMRIRQESDGTFSLNTYYPQIDSGNCYIYYATPVIADIDNDGMLEHVMSGGFNSFTVYKGELLTAPIVSPRVNAEWHTLMPPTAYNADGTVKNRGDSDLNGFRRLQGIADVDGDGKLEIGLQYTTGIEGDQYAGFMYCYEGEGTAWTDAASDQALRAGAYAWDNAKQAVKWKYDMRVQFGGQNVMANGIVTGDIDGDGKAEFVVSTNTGYLVVFNGEDDPADGRVLWSMRLGGGTKLLMPIIADIDNDGYVEIIVAAGDGALHFVDGPNRGSLQGTITQLMEKYIATGALNGSLIDQLTNSFKQAQHQLDNGRKDQAAKHMEDFIKHLNNEAKDDNITSTCREALNRYAESLIKSWPEE